MLVKEAYWNGYDNRNYLHDIYKPRSISMDDSLVKIEVYGEEVQLQKLLKKQRKLIRLQPCNLVSSTVNAVLKRTMHEPVVDSESNGLPTS